MNVSTPPPLVQPASSVPEFWIRFGVIRDHDAACRVDHDAVGDGHAKAGAE